MALNFYFDFGILKIMKRAFAVIIVFLLALSMLGMFFPALVSGTR